MKKWLCFILCFGMAIGAAGCEDNRTGTVENKEITLSLPYGERTGIYSGDVVKGIPEGNGKFESSNNEGTTWIYEGGFMSGVFEGEGKTTWDDGSVQIGIYHNGLWEASEWALLATYQGGGLLSATVESMDFIKENPNLFMANSKEDFINLVDEGISYKMLTKEPSKYGEKIIKISNPRVNQIFTSKINTDSDDMATYLLLVDNDGNVYEVYTVGEFPDIYDGDSLESVYGVSIGNNSFESTIGGFVNSIVIAPCWIQK